MPSSLLRFFRTHLTLATFLLLNMLAASCPAQAVIETNARGGLPHFFAKAKHGSTLRIGYLGGSITAAEGWRPLSLAWFRTAYPKNKFEEINAAVSGTGSELGVFRLQHDMLQFKPDLLFVEFAVNDEGEAPARIQRAMEGIVRQTWAQLPNTDICFLYTVNKLSLPLMEAGKNPPSVLAMEHIAEFYRIPSINVGLAAAKVMQSGKMVLTGPPPSPDAPKDAPISFSGDGTHPYPETGHLIYLHTLQQAFASMQSLPRDASAHRLGRPMDALNLEHAQETPLPGIQHTGNWTPTSLEDPTGQMARSLPHVWAGRAVGDSLSFSFTGTVFGIYGVKGPDAARFSVQIDNQPPLQQTLFDPYSTAGRYRCREWISQDLPPGLHHVRIIVRGPVVDKEKILHPGFTGKTEAHLNEPFALYIADILTDSPPSQPDNESKVQP